MGKSALGAHGYFLLGGWLRAAKDSISKQITAQVRLWLIMTSCTRREVFKDEERGSITRL